MKRNMTFAAFVVFAFLAGSSTAIPQQSSSTGPVLLNAPRGQAPVPVIKPIQENWISRQIQSAPAPRDVGAGQHAPQQQSQTTDRPPLMGVEHVPSSGAQQVRRRVRRPPKHARAPRWSRTSAPDAPSRSSPPAHRRRLRKSRFGLIARTVSRRCSSVRISPEEPAT